MNEILIKIIPVILIFILGYILKQLNVLTKDNGDLFLRLVFYVPLPALIILSVTKVQLSTDLIYLPITAVLIIFVTYVVSYFIGKLFNLNKSSFGVFLIASMIMNIGFTFPFFIAAYGEEGFTRVSLFDFGNSLMVFTFVFYMACKYGNNNRDSGIMIKKFLYSPPLWALGLAIILNLLNIKIPDIGINFFRILGDMVIPLIMLSLGIYFSPKIVKLKALLSIIIIRMFIGLMLGFLFVFIFDLEGFNKIIVIIGASAPVGYNTMTFSSMENLNKEFAASVISYSILIGMILIPVLIVLLS